MYADINANRFNYLYTKELQSVKTKGIYIKRIDEIKEEFTTHNGDCFFILL